MLRLLYAAIAVACVAADQGLKYWARTDLAQRPGGTIPIWQDVFHLTYVENRGAAFGILQNQRWFFVVLTTLLLAAFVYVLFIKKPVVKPIPGVIVAFLAGGAAGNLIDRAFLGFVTDVFDARIIGFAVFNIADICLVCSAIALGIWVFWSESGRRKKDEGVQGEGIG